MKLPIRYIMKLQQKAHFRNREGLFVCEGWRLVKEIPSALIECIYVEKIVSERPEIASWLSEKRLQAISVSVVEENVLKKMSDVVNPQGIIAVARCPSWKLRTSIEQESRPLLVYLENLQDPGNVGTIFRVAEAAGAAAIIANEGTADFYSPKTVRSTMGSLFRIPHYRGGDFGEFFLYAHEKGMKRFAAMLAKDSIPYDLADFRESCAIVIGNEGVGLSDETARSCDEWIHIPMAGQVESLNAGVAAGILLFEASRQRRGKFECGFGLRR